MDQLEKRKVGLIRWVKYYTNKCRKLLAEMAGVSHGGVSSAVEIKYTVDVTNAVENVNRYLQRLQLCLSALQAEGAVPSIVDEMIREDSVATCDRLITTWRHRYLQSDATQQKAGPTDADLATKNADPVGESATQTWSREEAYDPDPAAKKEAEPSSKKPGEANDEIIDIVDVNEIFENVDTCHVIDVDFDCVNEKDDDGLIDDHENKCGVVIDGDDVNAKVNDLFPEKNVACVDYHARNVGGLTDDDVDSNNNVNDDDSDSCDDVNDDSDDDNVVNDDSCDVNDDSNDDKVHVETVVHDVDECKNEDVVNLLGPRKSDLEAEWRSRPPDATLFSKLWRDPLWQCVLLDLQKSLQNRNRQTWHCRPPDQNALSFLFRQ